MIRLGLCCQNTELREKNIFCSRTLIRKNFTLKKVQDLALKNIKDIEKLCEWNFKNNIYIFRISSDIFPHFTDLEIEEVKNGEYTLEFAKEALKSAGEAAKKYNQRITMHPGQYNQVGAKEGSIFEKTVKDLEMHASILDLMEMDENSTICVHGGGVYGDKEKTVERWIKQFENLPQNVKRRLAIENCERCYSVNDCLTIAERCKIPLIFDNHHYECFNKVCDKKEQVILENVMERVVNTWKSRGLRPLFHISEQADGERLGTHSDYIEDLPQYYLDFPSQYGDVDIEVEAKMKEKAILKLYEKYPHIFRYKSLAI